MELLHLFHFITSNLTDYELTLYNRSILLILVLSLFLLEPASAQKSTTEVKRLLEAARRNLNSNPDSCLILAAEAYRQSELNQDHWAMSKSLTYSGRAREKIDQVQSAMEDYFYALKWITLSDTTDDYNSGILTRNIAAINLNYNNFSQAVKYYDSALFYLNRHVYNHPEIARKYKDHLLAYDTKYFKAESLWRMGQVLNSQEVLASLLKDSNTPVSLKVRSHYQIGFIYNEMERFDSAILSFKKGIAVEGVSASDLGRGWHNLAMTHFRKEEYKVATSLYRKAVQMKKELKDEKSLFISMLDLGESLLMDHRPEEALEIFNEAESLLDAQTIDANPKYYGIYQFKSRCLILTEGSEAQKWLLKFANCTQDFQKTQQVLRNKEQQKAFDLLMANLEAEMSHEQDLRTLDRKYSLWVLVILIGAVVASVLGVKSWLVYRRKKISKKINKAIRPRQIRPYQAP